MLFLTRTLEILVSLEVVVRCLSDEHAGAVCSQCSYAWKSPVRVSIAIIGMLTAHLLYQDASEPFEPFVRWGSAAAQGQRQAMEDAHVGVLDIQAHTDKALQGKGGAFFGVRAFALHSVVKRNVTASALSSSGGLMQVFDGHGGSSAAQFAEEHLLQALLTQTSFPAKPADALVRPLLP